MSKSKLISAVFTVADKDAALEKIALLKTSMTFLIGLTTPQRKQLRKMGPKSVDYVRQCLEGAKAFPDELKISFDTPELEKDYTLITNLLAVQIACQSVVELINDTMMAGGIDAMDASDEVYASLKISAKSNVNVKAMVEQIARRFKGQGRIVVPPTPPAAV